MPSVIRLRTFVKVPFRRRAPLNRRGIFARDDQRCQYCGAAAESIDHVIPRSRGGQHSWDNVVAACRPCNVRKRDRLLPETTMRPAPQPRHAPRPHLGGGGGRSRAHPLGAVPPPDHPVRLIGVLGRSRCRREPPSDLHAATAPGAAERTVWVADVTVPTLVLGCGPARRRGGPGCLRARRRGGDPAAQRGGAVLVEPGPGAVARRPPSRRRPALGPLTSASAFLWLGEVWRDALRRAGRPGPGPRGWALQPPWSRLVCFGGLGTGEVVDEGGVKLVGLSQRRTRAGARFQCMAMAAWDPEAIVALLALSPQDRSAAVDALAGAARAVPVPLDDLLRRGPRRSSRSPTHGGSFGRRAVSLGGAARPFGGARGVEMAAEMAGMWRNGGRSG